MKPEQTLFDGVVSAAMAGGALKHIAEDEARKLVDEYKKYGFQYTKSASNAVEKFSKAAIKRSKLIEKTSQRKT